jgi:hypothetical protein
LKEYVNNFDLNTSVFYDAQHDIQHILSQSTIGILASTAEGFSFTRIWFSSTGSLSTMSAIVRVLLSQILG